MLTAYTRRPSSRVDLRDDYTPRGIGMQEHPRADMMSGGRLNRRSVAFGMMEVRVGS
jgi:hypothetical protein